jgi:hypothetical protein
VGGVLVAVAVGAMALFDCGLEVAVASGLLLFAAVALVVEGFLVTVGFGSSSFDEPLPDLAVFVAVAVGDESRCAASGEAESLSSLRSSGAPGGGFSAPAADGDEPPARSASVVVGSDAESSPPKSQVAIRPAEMVSAPAATNPTAIALGLMTSLLVPRVTAGSLEATSLQRAEGSYRVCRPSLGRRNIRSLFSNRP